MPPAKRCSSRELWLVVVGARRHELTLLEVQQAYRQRYDLEHFFRFGKQRLLLASFQTPDAAREANWLQLGQLAYTQLYLSRTLVNSRPRPWERYLPSRLTGVTTPTTTQRDFAYIIRPLGTPAQAPKRRGNAPGRVKGMCPGAAPPLCGGQKKRSGGKKAAQPAANRLTGAG